MIARSPLVEQSEQRPSRGWKADLADAIRDPGELLAFLRLSEHAPLLAAGDAGFPLLVPRAFAARMQPGNAADPLLAQVLPLSAETRPVDGYGHDPVGEQGLLDGSGLLRKYDGRALLVVAGSCAVHCRYCFRRSFPYRDTLGGDALGQAMATIAADRSISEVILSGGDPLLVSDTRLDTLLDELRALDHVRRVRIHTRLPVVLPTRIDASLCAVFERHRRGLVMVIHANHPREIDTGVGTALHALRAAGVTLFNQSVLLRGVNDKAETLAELCETLFEHGVVPYYVHQLDRVAGAAHFEVDDDTARQLESALRARLPGYLVPRFVRETPGAAAKLPL